MKNIKKSAFKANHMTAQLVIAAMLTLVTGCESRAAEQASLIPSLAELEPTILCMGATGGENALSKCLRPQVAADYQIQGDPRTPEDFKRMTLAMWAQVVRKDAIRLTKQQFASALDYATCVERATNAFGGLPGPAEDAIRLGQRKASDACADHEQSPQSVLKRYTSLLAGLENKPPANALNMFFLSNILSSVVYIRAIKANGWVTDAMTPCIRYSDGKPPSPGCAGKPVESTPVPPK